MNNFQDELNGNRNLNYGPIGGRCLPFNTCILLFNYDKSVVHVTSQCTLKCNSTTHCRLCQ